MDDDFRNRLRRYDNGAPLRPRPSAPRPVQAPAPIAQPPKPVAPRPAPAPIVAPKREPVPERQIFEHLITEDKPKKTKTKRAKKAKKKSHKKGLLTAFILLLLLGSAAAAGWFVVKPRLLKPKAQPTQQSTASTTQQTTTKPAAKLVRIEAVGDSIAYSSINQAAKTGDSYDYAPMMSAIKPLFTKAALRICDQTVPAGGVGGSVSGPPTFNAPTQFAKGLIDTGCNVFNLASPNTNDKGQDMINASLNNFANKPEILAVAGANKSAEEQSNIKYFEVEGLKFAFLAYTTSSNVANPTPYGVNVYSEALVDAQVKQARENAGVVIVGMHWGTDQAADQNADQDAIAQHLANLNADIILGAGPHVIQPVKVLTGSDGKHQTIVWFSLGNFLHSQVPTETVIGGMAVMDIDASTGQLHDPRLLPLYMHYEWTPEQKQRQNDADLLARKNFQLVPLDTAAPLLAKSQNGTTVEAQQTRIKAIVNKYFQIPLITAADL